MLPRQALRQTRRILRPLLDIWPWTARGVLFAAVAAIALFSFGHDRLDLVLLVLGYGGLGLLVLTTVLVVITAIALKVKLRAAPGSDDHLLRTETGRALPTDFSLPLLGWIPLLQLSADWESPEGFDVELRQEGRRFREYIVARSRGEVRDVRRRIIVQDAFGLSRVALRVRGHMLLDVLPHLGGIRHLPVLTSLAGGEEQPHPLGLEDGDRLELRRYVPGDPARFIHWKVFGRTRKLMIRMPERALSHARRTVAYLIAGEHDEASAAAARAALQRGVFGNDWSFGADGSPGATSDLESALHKIIVSSAARGRGGSGLKAFLDEVEREGPATLVVFAPPQPGAWISTLRSLGKQRAHVVIATDAIQPSVGQHFWRRWLYREQKQPGPVQKELDELMNILRTLRCDIVVLDRVSGRVVADTRRTLPHRRAA